MTDRKDIVTKYKGNPIISTSDIPQPCNSVFNAAATKYKGNYILLLRVEGLEGKSKFFLAKSKDGLHFNIQEKPVMQPSEKGPFAEYEKRGLEDPRITWMEEENIYYIVYTAYSHNAPRIAIAKTKDFHTFERVALASEPENKNGVLLPKKIKGQYVRYDRPVTGEGLNMWISYSPDLIYWGNSKCIMETRPGYWDRSRIGAGPPSFETEKGWLQIYHGAKGTAWGSIYRLGCAMFDLKNPSKLISRGELAIISATQNYERTGDAPNVIFSCGAILEDNGEVKIYYGAADSCICLATTSLDNLIDNCFRR